MIRFVRLCAGVFVFFLVAGGEKAFAVDITAWDRQDVCAPGTYTLEFSLRSDFNDLGPTCPTDYIHAQGATLSWANNLITHQNTAALDGLAAFDYRWYGNGDLVGFAAGGYVQGDDTYQFNPSKTQTVNGETITPGAFAEILINDPFTRAVQGGDDFRVRGGDAISTTGTTSTTFVGEWIPTYAIGGGANIGLPNYLKPLWYTLAPELMIQYDRLTGGPNKSLLFLTGNEALRIGPEFLLQLSLDKSSLSGLPKPMQEFLGNLSALITNHESWDTYSGRAYNWTQVSLSYTFPQITHLGLTASYGYGNSEATANVTNQVKVGLAGKF